MRITLIGGTRFIGPATAEELLRRGHDVTLIHRGIHACETEGVEVITADRADEGALRHALGESVPDAVIDTRSMTEEDAHIACRALEGMFAVVLSSQDVYAQFGRLNGLAGPEPQARVDEESPLTIPFPFRGIAEHAGGEMYDKKLVEGVYASAAGRTLHGATVLRLPAVYGRRDPARRFGNIVDALDGGATHLPRCDGAAFRWTHVHVDNVAHAIALAAEQRSEGYGVFNVGEEDAPSMAQWAEAFAEIMGCDFQWRDVEELEDEWSHFGVMPNDMVADTTRFRERFGYRPPKDMRARLVDTLAGLRRSRIE